MTAAVEVTGVSRQFGAVAALSGITLQVRPGELFGLVGPDGAGKTTLFRILATLLVPHAGTATVLGHDVVRNLWDIRARVGYMPGTFSLYPDLTVLENLRFFAAVFGTTVEAGYDLIAPVYRQLEPFRERRADALSGGMKQKLALSCALVHRPDLLLLDEPTTGVDAVSRREFWDQLARLQADGLTVVVSTPYMDEALRCDRVALIQSGRILEVDAPARIAQRYPLPLVAVRGGDRHRLLQTLRASPYAASVYPFGEDIHVSDVRTAESADALAAAWTTYLHDHGHADADVRAIAAGIEDAFMALMAGSAA